MVFINILTSICNNVGHENRNKRPFVIITYMIYTRSIMKKEKSIMFSDLKKELLKDPEFKKGYDALEVEFSLIWQILRKRIEKDISQEEFAKRLGTNQSAISRLESGTYNPSLKFLKRVAKALGAELKITLV